ncbi:MAG TPA: ATP-binding cassette domain-containing protein [Thermoanaerobaculia bacterium]|nr:ATP-binding cassette domain-containing protein [Thermoanaerobaculia bacterium]
MNEATTGDAGFSPAPAALPRQSNQDHATSSGAVVARGLRHVYKGGTVALDGVDLEIGAGLFGLLGPNGAGKSTLMRILCTLLAPTQGSASVFGHDVVGERAAVRSVLGYLPQEFGAWRLHRVEEVLGTLASLSGLSDPRERVKRVGEVLEMVGLEEVGHRKVKKLSGGMLRRLGIAQALVHEPRLLVVDEPTVGLDPEERIRFRQLMAALGRERTIILSTHIVADLGAGCRDLALLDDGKVVFRGSPVELLARAKGQVFEVAAPSGGGPPELDAEVVSSSSVGGQMVYRFVAAKDAAGAGSLPAGAREVESVTLEEGYLAFMTTRGRAEAAAQVEAEAAS